MTQTIGHRGAAALEPENTLRALRKGIELGMEYVEFDLHRCKSGEIIVFHDDTLERTTNGKGLVSETTLQQLKKLDAGKGERIPTFQEAIETCKSKVKMNIELKDHGLERDVIHALVENSISAEDFFIISFIHEAVKKAKEEAAKHNMMIKTGVLIAGNPLNVGEMAKAANADFVSANHFFVDERMVKQARKAGLGFTVWTVNTEHDMKRMMKLGVDMIASDRPDLLNKVLGR